MWQLDCSVDSCHYNTSNMPRKAPMNNAERWCFCPCWNRRFWFFFFSCTAVEINFNKSQYFILKGRVRLSTTVFCVPKRQEIIHIYMQQIVCPLSLCSIFSLSMCTPTCSMLTICLNSHREHYRNSQPVCEAVAML